jgi:hypothetical protein
MATDTEYRDRFQLIGGIILAIVLGVPLCIGGVEMVCHDSSRQRFLRDRIQS